MICIFFFKQKTAYEMRSSDWSSDVCSSDLYLAGDGTDADRIQDCVVSAVTGQIGQHGLHRRQRYDANPGIAFHVLDGGQTGGAFFLTIECDHRRDRFGASIPEQTHRLAQRGAGRQHVVDDHDTTARRSDEHTSELQSLMRISYAVSGF